MKNLKSELEGTVEKSMTKLQENENEWISRYKDYPRRLDKARNAFRKARKIGKKHKLMIYSSISKSRTFEIDLRYLGQNVAKGKWNGKKKTFLISTGKFCEKNDKYLGIDTSLSKMPFGSVEVQEFINAFDGIDDKATRSKEHEYESILLSEFSKISGKENKLLRHIQPVTLNGCFFQMATPLKASKHAEIDYAGEKGGGIDILARVSRSRLCVFELKDKSESNEDYRAALKQATAYATFIACLLKSTCGQAWWKCFGFNGAVPKKLVLYVCSLFPEDANGKGGDKGVFESFQLSVKELSKPLGNKVTIEFHTLYCNSDKELKFSGTLLDRLKESNR